MADQFDRDFGYLMPFLDKVAGAAKTLKDPAARDELTRLIAEEKQRWARIRTLLGGASASAGQTAKPVPARTEPTAPSGKAPGAKGPEPRGFTVGSLKGTR